MGDGATTTRAPGRATRRLRRVRVGVAAAVAVVLGAFLPAVALGPVVAGATSPPVVSSYAPHSGPAVGGTLVTLHGSGFTGVSTVLFGSQSATSVTVVNDALLEAQAPGGADGSVNVSVYTPGGVVSVPYFYGPVSSFNVIHAISPSSTAVSPEDIVSGPNGDLWFAYGNASAQSSIGELTPTGALTVYTDPSINEPRGLTAGPNGSNDLWFTNFGNNTIGRIDANGVVHSYTGTGINHPEDITVGPDNALWFTNSGTVTSAGSIGRITAAGVVTNYTGTGISNPWQITAGPSGNGDLWFSNLGNNTVGRILTDGTVTNFSDPTVMNRPWGITADSGAGTGSGVVFFTNSTDGSIGSISETSGHPTAEFSDPAVHATTELTLGPDNALWFPNGSRSIGRATINASNVLGGLTTYSSPLISGAVNLPFGITAGPDSALWFTEPADGLVGRFAPADVDVQPTVSAVSPASGLAAGGTTVTVTGTGFVAGATTVSFGATSATDVSVTSPTTLTATAPAGSGTVDVTVTTPGGTSSAGTADQFAYGFAITTPPGSLGTAVIGTPFAAALTADGGVTPYKFKVTVGALPKGIKLNAKTGVIAGTVKPGKKAPAPGTFTFTVTATDHTKGTKQTASATFSIDLTT